MTDIAQIAAEANRIVEESGIHIGFSYPHKDIANAFILDYGDVLLASDLFQGRLSSGESAWSNWRHVVAAFERIENSFEGAPKEIEEKFTACMIHVALRTGRDDAIVDVLDDMVGMPDETKFSEFVRENYSY